MRSLQKVSLLTSLGPDLNPANPQYPATTGVTDAAQGVEVLTAPLLSEIPWLWHGFSTRAGGVSEAYGVAGDLNLGFTAEDDRACVEENRLRFVEAVTGSRGTPLVTMRQIHSNLTVQARIGETAAADGIVTGLAPPVGSGLLLGILTADCIPVLVADRRRRVVGAFHAEWRGTVERIGELGVQSMRETPGAGDSDGPYDLVAAIGPGIGACCYAVGSEVHDRFLSKFKYCAELFDKDEVGGLRLNLIEANRRQLMDAGVAAESISIVGGCTQCTQDLFYTHRGSGGRAGRMMAVIGIR